MMVSKRRLSAEFAQNISKWHHSGFHVHCGPPVEADQPQALERLAAYILRPSFASTRVRYLAGSGQVHYRRAKGVARSMDALDWIAQVISYIPDPGEQMVRYYGWYSNASRGKRRKPGVRVPVEAEVQDTPQPDSDGEHFARQRRRSWAQLLKKIYQVDPLRCPHCGSEMHIIAWIEQSEVIRKILRPLDLWERPQRSPPPSCFLTSWKPLWLLSPPDRPKKSEPPRIRFSGTMSRSGISEEPRLFTLLAISVCRFSAPLTLIPALLALSHPQGRLCLSCSVASPKNTALHPLFEPRSTSLKKETPICSVCEGDEQRTYLAGLRKFCKHSLLNSFFIRRDIAGALLKAQEYNL
jgi:hypothetical protein